MKSQYEHVTWVEDEDGERLVCFFDDEDNHPHEYEKMTDQEKKHCKPVEFPWN